ncbi:MAG: hypothetical protein LBR36_03465 [Bacteroidales bacterium]|jgi:hypothetical protein|nr:hypothetical protein [Bacteroidales bacterium]
MNIIKNNPYRILGLLAGASAREITRQSSWLKQYIEAASDTPVDYSFPSITPLRRTIEDIDAATNTLVLDDDKMLAALFWFWGNNETDKKAFEMLKAEDNVAAEKIWAVSVQQAGICPQNCSSFHNLSLLYLLSGKTKEAIRLQLLFLESHFLENFKESITDVTYQISPKELQIKFLNAVYEECTQSDRFLFTQFVEFIKEQNFVAKEDFLKKLAQKGIAKIDTEIQIAQNQCQTDKNNALKAGNQLKLNTANVLDDIKSLLGKKDVEYAMIADRLAEEMLNCCISSFNETSPDVNDVITLIKYSLSIAVGTKATERIKENLEIITAHKAYALCWYCGENTPDKACTYERKLFHVTSRDYTGTYYEWVNAPVPRCKRCKKYHSAINNANNFILPIILCFILSLFIGLPAGSDITFLIIGFLLIGCTIGLTTRIAKLSKIDSAEIKENNSSSKGSIIFLSVVICIPFIIGLLISMYRNTADNRWLATFIGSFISVLLAIILNIVETPKGLRKIKRKNNIHNFPPIRERIDKGWTFRQPS